MTILYPALLGLGTKLYDDLVDHQIKIPSIALYGVQAITILLLILTLQGEFYLSFFMGTFGLFNPGFDTPFWKLFTFVCLVTMWIQLPHAGDHILRNLIILSAPLLLLIAVTSIEYTHLSEEVSIQKIISRIVFLMIAGASLLVPYKEWFHLPTELHRTFYLFTIIFIFYLLYSVISMSYLFFDKK
jgi:hypothetical protein